MSPPVPDRVRGCPSPPLAGRFRPPGDKSITHRALLLGLLAEGETRIGSPNRGADCEGTRALAGALGARVEDAGDALRVQGRAGTLAAPAAALDCGNSGTTLRLLAGILAGQPFRSTLTGDASLSRRPMARIVEPLRRMGARVSARDGDRYPPLVIEGGRLAGIRWTLPVASAQVASCVLLAGLSASGPTVVELPGPARDHTERMLPAFGVAVEVEPRAGLGPRLAVNGPAPLRAAEVAVPADFSAAAFFLAAAAGREGAAVTARGVSLNPTRTGLLDVLVAMGAAVQVEATGTSGGEPRGDVTVTGRRLAAFDVPPEWVPRMIDEVPAWVVAATAATGTSRLRGARELRVKESDRLSALARGLSSLGVGVVERADGLEVTGGPVEGGTIEAAGDHRIAMAFLALAQGARAPVVVGGADGIATSYPGFLADLAGLGGGAEPEAV